MSDYVFPQTEQWDRRSALAQQMHADGAGDLGLTVKGGLTKRELFAAMAMQGVISSIKSDQVWSSNDVAECALGCADALIAKLEGK